MLFAQGRLVDDRYRLHGPIGFGGMGTVWAALDESNGEKVALKLLHAPSLSGKEALAFAQREASVLSRLQHPHVVGFHAVELEHQPPYVVTELVEGTSLDKIIGGYATSGKPMPLDDIQRISVQVGQACHHAHEEGIIHRDLKPQNILVTKEPSGLRAVVLDFGIARLVSGSPTEHTTRGRVSGTTYYLSPEQILGEHQDLRVDVFALSTVVFEMLTGRRGWLVDQRGPIPAFVDSIPQEMNDMGSVMRRILNGPRPEVKKYRPDVPSAWAEAVRRGLSALPNDRPVSMLEWLSAFEESRAAPPELDAPVKRRLLALVDRLDADADSSGPTFVDTIEVEPNQELSLVRAVPVHALAVEPPSLDLPERSESPLSLLPSKPPPLPTAPPLPDASQARFRKLRRGVRPFQIAVGAAVGALLVLALQFMVSDGGGGVPADSSWRGALVRYRLQSSPETGEALEAAGASMVANMRPEDAREFEALVRLALESRDGSVIEMVFRKGEAWSRSTP